MQFKDLDTKTPQDAGAFMQLTHTKYGWPMYTGPNTDGHGKWIGKEEPEPDQAVGLIVRGMEAQTIEEFTRNQKRKMLLNSRKKNPMDEAELEYESGLKFACALIVKFVNIFDGDEVLAPTDENKRAFIQLSDDLSTQILTFARDRENFFVKLSSD